MARPVTAEDARELLRSAEGLNGNAFAILDTIARLSARSETASDARDVLVRLLDRRLELPVAYTPMLEALVTRLGLYPYVESTESLSTSDQLAFEYHRPPRLEDERFVFHSIQRVIYDRLMDGQSIVLSAPTSFGKSAIVDALVASGRWHNIVIVVPTLALIDEIRRRLARFSDLYKVITFPVQHLASRNLLVMTQERLLQMRELPAVDFFIIDEFYKLDPAGDDDRYILLNIAWDRLRRTGAQYYMTGPNVTNLHHALPEELRDNLIVTDFRTVAIEEKFVQPGDERQRLAQVCARLRPPSLVYCKSPRRVGEVGHWLLEDGIGNPRPSLAEAADWIARNFDEEWIVGRCLREGVGLHHGRLPRALQHHIVRLFNGGLLDYLICTSTLIEGVNTSAKNVIILDGKLSTKDLDYFTFSNIRGRAGRMFRHFIGTVCIFKKPPSPVPMTVDIPISSQSAAAPTAALIQLPREELTSESYERVRHIYEQDLLDIELIRLNKGIDPDRQLDLAREIQSMPDHYSSILHWRGHPTWDQLVSACELLMGYLIDRRQHGRMTARALAARLNVARQNPGDIRAMVNNEMRYAIDRDEAVEEVLSFLRNWAGHTTPHALRALNHIQRAVLGRLRLKRGNYRYFASAMEDQFLPQYLVNLEEYGLPVQIARKLVPLGLRAPDLDGLLKRLQVLAASPHLSNLLDSFEREVLDEVAKGLGPQTLY